MKTAHRDAVSFVIDTCLLPNPLSTG